MSLSKRNEIYALPFAFGNITVAVALRYSSPLSSEMPSTVRGYLIVRKVSWERNCAHDDQKSLSRSTTYASNVKLVLGYIRSAGARTCFRLSFTWDSVAILQAVLTTRSVKWGKQSFSCILFCSVFRTWTWEHTGVYPVHGSDTWYFDA